jgi:transcriptional regulator with XRE-family HTH domain
MASRLPDRGSPSARGRRLAIELRRLRERTGLTGEDVAQHLGWSGSKVSRIERHRTGVKPEDLRQLLKLYAVEETYGKDLVALALESVEKDPLQQAASSFPPEYATYLSAEAEAESVWNWEPQVVPGLLQIRDYAWAAIQPWRKMIPGPRDTDRRVEARLLRQQVLTRDPPLELSVVIDESVLHRRIGTRAVMRQQLEHLVQASELPNVEVRVHRLDDDVPFTAGAFSYMQFPRVHDVPSPDLVSVEYLEGTYYLEYEEQTYQYRVAFEHLVSRSLDPAQSRSIISTAKNEAWS